MVSKYFETVQISYFGLNIHRAFFCPQQYFNLSLMPRRCWWVGGTLEFVEGIGVSQFTSVNPRIQKRVGSPPDFLHQLSDKWALWMQFGVFRARHGTPFPIKAWLTVFFSQNHSHVSCDLRITYDPWRSERSGPKQRNNCVERLWDCRCSWAVIMMFGTGVPDEFNYTTDPQLRKMVVGDFHSLNIFLSFFLSF